MALDLSAGGDKVVLLTHVFHHPSTPVPWVFDRSADDFSFRSEHAAKTDAADSPLYVFGSNFQATQLQDYLRIVAQSALPPASVGILEVSVMWNPRTGEFDAYDSAHGLYVLKKEDYARVLSPEIMKLPSPFKL